MSQFTSQLTSNPMTIGLFIGLTIALLVALQGWLRRRALIKEHQIFREYMNTHIAVHSRGSQELMSELESLKKQNENLRVSLGSLKAKPGRDELRTLHMYDKAIRLMNQRAPGFAPVWEMALNEVEIEFRQMDTGVVAWVRRIIRPSLVHGTTQQMSERDSLNQPVDILKTNRTSAQ